MQPEAASVPAAEVAAAMQRSDRVFHALGMELVSVAPGRACLEMAVREDMLNGHDICHGGMVFTLADTAFAYAANAHNRTTLAAAADISFIAAAEAGETLRALAEERSLSRRTGVYDVTVTGRDGRLIALARCHAHRLNSEIVSESGSPQSSSQGEPP